MTGLTLGLIRGRFGVRASVRIVTRDAGQRTALGIALAGHQSNRSKADGKRVGSFRISLVARRRVGRSMAFGAGFHGGIPANVGRGWSFDMQGPRTVTTLALYPHLHRAQIGPRLNVGGMTVKAAVDRLTLLRLAQCGSRGSGALRRMPHCHAGPMQRRVPGSTVFEVDTIPLAHRREGELAGPENPGEQSCLAFTLQRGGGQPAFRRLGVGKRDTATLLNGTVKKDGNATAGGRPQGTLMHAGRMPSGRLGVAWRAGCRAREVLCGQGESKRGKGGGAAHTSSLCWDCQALE